MTTWRTNGDRRSKLTCLSGSQLRKHLQKSVKKKNDYGRRRSTVAPEETLAEFGIIGSELTTRWKTARCLSGHWKLQRIIKLCPVSYIIQTRMGNCSKVPVHSNTVTNHEAGISQSPLRFCQDSSIVRPVHRCHPIAINIQHGSKG